MWNYAYKGDEESGSAPLYPTMLENPELRWSFIRKVYSIVAIQLVLSIAVLCPLYYYHQKHPYNYILLGIFTVALSFAVGLTCAYTSGKVILEAAILTAAVVIALTLYTFWAAKRGQDFNFLGPFLFGAILVLMLFSLIQMFFPMGKISVMIYGGLASIVFCGYIVYDTDNLIKRYTAAVRVDISSWERTLIAELMDDMRRSRSAPMATAASTHCAATSIAAEATAMSVLAVTSSFPVEDAAAAVAATAATEAASGGGAEKEINLNDIFKLLGGGDGRAISFLCKRTVERSAAMGQPSRR
nr:BI1-like protein [Ipomoea batatas]